ncbi:hypothetical protein AB0M12_32145 [Nocardia vinacea]|uniref:hypothetical protein n=1 Tax=Nocardia vinacea TaxID=96468 RepID=UPI003445EE8F
MNSRPLAPDDTAALGLDPGELVEVRSRRGATVLAVRRWRRAASKHPDCEGIPLCRRY